MATGDIFSPLDTKKREIRLLEILSTKNNAQASCRLHTVSLNEKPVFTALSYVWGDATITEAITLDGHEFQVTTNLAAALRHVKNHWCSTFPERDAESLRLWADAICIDQSSVLERNAQVPLMRAVYSEAELVVSWLGLGRDDIALALQTFDIIVHETQSDSTNRLQIEWMQRHPHLCQQDKELQLGENRIIKFKSKAWVAVQLFFYLEYWSRVWIFQEILLARKILLAHGPHTLKFEDLRKACQWFAATEKILAKSIVPRPAFLDHKIWTGLHGSWYNHDRISFLSSLKEIVQGNKIHEQFAPFLFGLRGWVSTDPRDQIYGFLGVVPWDIAPDYDKPIAQVYQEFLLTYLKEAGCTEFLSSAGITTRNRDLDMPSWVPDYAAVSRSSTGPNCSNTRLLNRNILSGIPQSPTLAGRVLRHVALLGPVITKVEEAFTWDRHQTGEFREYVRQSILKREQYVTGFHTFQAILEVFLEVNSSLNSSGYSMAIAFATFIESCQDSQYIKSASENMQEFRFFGILAAKDLIEMFVPDDEVKKQLAHFEDRLNLPTGETELEYDAMGLIYQKLEEHRLLEVEGGYIGLAPPGTQAGDRVAVIKGCDSLLVLREVDNHYILVGTCFVLGLMNGEFGELEQARLAIVDIW